MLTGWLFPNHGAGLTALGVEIPYPLLIPIGLFLAFVVTASVRFASINLHSRKRSKEIESPYVKLPWLQVIVTGLAIGVAALIVQQWTVYSLSREGSSSSGPVELFLAGAVPMAAALYFLYQLAAGALFATTSVTLEIERADTRPTSAVVSMKLERGDHWMVEIASAAVAQKLPYHEEQKWQEANLPRRRDGTLRLAPKETMSTRFRIKLDDQTADTVVTARVVTYALWWPMPSESFASTLIVPQSAGAASSAAPRP